MGTENQQATTGQEMAVDKFEADIFSGKYNPVKTGISGLDTALGGGVLRQTITTISGPPGTGKTCLATQMAEYYALSGYPVVYINLEMSQEQLLARSVARIIHKNFHSSELSAQDILRAYNLEEKSQKQVTLAIDIYRNSLAHRLSYDMLEGNSVEEFEKKLRDLEEKASKDGTPAPIVVIDYLQLLSGGAKSDATETVKRAITALKRYAIKNDTITFAITAQNREANRPGAKPTMAGGRDSSAIEYTSDVVVQLVNAESGCEMHIVKSRFSQGTKGNGIRYQTNGINFDLSDNHNNEMSIDSDNLGFAHTDIDFSNVPIS